MVTSVLHFFKVWPRLSQHTVTLCSDTFTKFQMVLIFYIPFEDVDRWTSVTGEVEACFFLRNLFREIVTRTCSHPFFNFCGLPSIQNENIVVAVIIYHVNSQQHDKFSERIS